MALKTRIRRSGALQPTVSLTPLIDTALTLLVVFMVTASVAHRAIRVDLPRGVTDDVVTDRQRCEVVVSVDAQEKIFLNGNECSVPDVIQSVVVSVGDTTKPVVVFLNVDRHATCGVALELLDELRKVEGVQCIAFDIARP